MTSPSARRAGRGHQCLHRLLAWFAVAPGAPAWGRGWRLATAMIVPLAVGVIVGQPVAGLLVGVGAFVVGSTDTGAPYRPRAVTMIAATLGVTAAYFLGALTASPRWLSVLLFVSVLAGSALIGTVGPPASLVSTMVAVAFIIGAFLPASPAADARAALALLGGGAWALGLSLAGWSFDHRRPERRAVSAAIGSCAAFLGELDRGGPGATPPGSGARESAGQSLSAARRTLEAGRPGSGSAMTPEVRGLWAQLSATGALFDAIVAAGSQLDAADRAAPATVPPENTAAVAALRAAVAGAAEAVRAERAWTKADRMTRLTSLGAAMSAQLERLGSRAESRRAAGQPDVTLTMMHLVGDAVAALIAAVSEPAPGPAWLPRRTGKRGWPTIVRAVRQPDAAVLGGAIRLAVAGGIALVIAGIFDPAHGAWLVSSAILVLKPNVSGTLSTAVQRAAATVIGAVIAGGIVAVVANDATLIALSFVVAVVAMAVMPLSYSVGMVVITPLSVLLTAVLTGGGWVIAVSRVENILIGVAIAVIVSCLWFPAWLRTSVPGLLASTIGVMKRAVSG